MIAMSPRRLSHILRVLPNFLWPLRWYIIKKSLKKAGRNFKFGYNSEFADHRLIEIGDDVFMGLNTIINTTVPVKVGNNVMFGRSVTIMGGDHNMSEVGIPMRFVKSGGKNEPVIIEDDVWVGSNVTVLKGIRLHEGCVVGAGSVVVKDLPPYSINVGNPCRPLKLRFNREELQTHLTACNSQYTAQEVEEQFDQMKRK